MSSKIIKSSHLEINNPRTIINRHHIEEPLVEEVITVESELVATDDIAKQADEIIKETEEMVKDLMTTAKREAEKIIDEARDEAENTLGETMAKVEKIEKDAFALGYQEGYTEAKTVADDEIMALKEEAKNNLMAAYQEKDIIIKSSESEIVKLATAIAKKIIHQEIKTDPDIIINIVRAAMQKVGNNAEINLLVNPENLDTIINAKDELMSLAKGVREMQIVADKSIPPTGCVIETENETLDARVEKQLAEIEQSMMDVNEGG